MKSDVQKLLKEWQCRLGLEHWNIILRDNCAPEDMQLQNVAGESDWVEELECGVVRLLDAKYYGKRIEPYDKEKTLVHELLHLKFTFLWNDDGGLQQRIVHQLIECLAKALVDAKRSVDGN